MTSFKRCLALSVLALGVASSGFTAHAQSSEARVEDDSSARLTAPIQQKEFEDTHTLTDAKMRVDAGSLSRFSLKANLGYAGPGMNDWAQKNRPNPDGTVGNYAQSITGRAMVRYRLTSDSAINVGAGGITINQPFHGNSRTDVAEPFVSYDVSSRFGELEMTNSVSGVVSTTPEFTDSGEVGGVMWDGSLSRKLGSSRFSLALDAELAYWAYGRGFRDSDGVADQWYFMATPIIRYNVSDNLNLFTNIGFTWANPRPEGDVSVLHNRMVTWKTGFGYAIGRAVYIAPFIQSYVTQVSMASTTLNVNTIFSIF